MKDTEKNTATQNKKHFCILHSAFCIKDYLSLSYLALIVLFCFAIATSFMSISYMAKYLSTDGGFDGARVAQFDVRVTKIDNNAFVISESDSTAVYTFDVENHSEVGIKYSVDVVFEENLPSNITISMGSTSYTGSDTNKRYIFSGYTIPTDGINEHTLTITGTTTENRYDSNVQVIVNAEQIN